jgi:predicted DNA-binding protein YlxM (UPF0122 family)
MNKFKGNITDKQLALHKLQDSLKLYDFRIDTKLYENIADNMTMLKYMNMTYLASAFYLYFLTKGEINKIKKYFSNDESMKKILGTLNSNPTDKQIIRMKEILYIYLSKIKYIHSTLQ